MLLVAKKSLPNDAKTPNSIGIKFPVILQSSSAPELNEINQFSIQLADNQYGKWLGQGSGSLLTYEQVFIQNKVLKPGKYTVTIWQNMRDPKITNVVDMGLKATKGEPNF